MRGASHKKRTVDGGRQGAKPGCGLFSSCKIGESLTHRSRSPLSRKRARAVINWYFAARPKYTNSRRGSKDPRCAGRMPAPQRERPWAGGGGLPALMCYRQRSHLCVAQTVIWRKAPDERLLSDCRWDDLPGFIRMNGFRRAGLVSSNAQPPRQPP
jgi:hypothetical protein